MGPCVLCSARKDPQNTRSSSIAFLPSSSWLSYVEMYHITMAGKDGHSQTLPAITRMRSRGCARTSRCSRSRSRSCRLPVYLSVLCIISLFQSPKSKVRSPKPSLRFARYHKQTTPATKLYKQQRGIGISYCSSSEHLSSTVTITPLCLSNQL
jgi:hypothetical protein